MEYKIFEFGNSANFNSACDWLDSKQIHFFKHSYYITILIFENELDLLNENELNFFYNEILE